MLSMSYRFNKQSLVDLAKERGMSAAAVLRRAGVSRNAYYNLINKSSLLPNSVEQIAEVLAVSPEQLIVADNSEEAKIKRKMLFVQKLLKDNPELDSGTSMTTLKLLELSPLQRLEISIRYGKAAASF